jgi:hypothetical protein
MLTFVLVAGSSLASRQNETTTASAPLQCGVASTVFTQNVPTIETALATGKLAFWWNWNTAMNVDTTSLSPPTLALFKKKFVPMIWGTGAPPSYDFLKDHEGHIMGFNEPDQ